MSKLLKQHISNDLKRRFEKVESYILVDYRGLDSAQSFDLRRALNGAGVRMSVVPNRLAVRILDRWAGRRKEFRSLFRGPTALVYGADGALAASRVVAQWKKKNRDLLALKGGIFGDEILTPERVESLARIPERKQLLAQVAGTLQAPLSRLAAATQGILSRMAFALEAHRKKLGGGAAEAGSPEGTLPPGGAEAGGVPPAGAAGA
ncbi:MAG: 50S ribosomal protein L10 [Thermoanaerobaculia bacterium]